MDLYAFYVGGSQYKWFQTLQVIVISRRKVFGLKNAACGYVPSVSSNIFGWTQPEIELTTFRAQGELAPEFKNIGGFFTYKQELFDKSRNLIFSSEMWKVSLK